MQKFPTTMTLEQIEEFSIELMRDVGLETDVNGNIIDQDTENILYYNGGSLKLPSMYNRGDMYCSMFNPLIDFQLMSYVFMWFLTKFQKEEGVEVSTVYMIMDNKNNSYGSVACNINGRVVKSDPYYKDSLKYASLIKKLETDALATPFYQQFDEEPIFVTYNKSKRK